MRLGTQYAIVATKVSKGSLIKKGDILETAKTRKELDNHKVSEGVIVKVQKINVTLEE